MTEKSQTTITTVQQIGRTAYAAGFSAAIEFSIGAIRRCGSLDENGYICEKSTAIKAVREIPHD